MKKITNITKKLSYILILGLAAVACSDPGANLDPNVPTPKSPQDDAVVAHVKGIKMVVQADTWPADPGITKEVTPLQVTIHNNSDRPLVVSYNSFAILTSNGEYHAAIPPFETQGKVDQLELGQDYEPIKSNIDYESYEVAPLYGPIYDIGVYDAYDFYDYDYYDLYYGVWNNFDAYNSPLPTGQMLAYAIPEGVVKPGGMIKGFLYFQKIEASESGQFRFTAELQNAETGMTFGEISIPYDIVSD